MKTPRALAARPTGAKRRGGRARRPRKPARGTTMPAERLYTPNRGRRRRKPHGARRSVATERPSEASGSETSPPTTNTPHGCGVAEGSGRGRKRGRRANEGTRRPTAPRDDGAHGRLTDRCDSAGGKTDGAPRNEEGRETREPREPEGVAAGALSAPSCPRRGDNLTFVNCVLSNCKTVTYTYLGMEI